MRMLKKWNYETRKYDEYHIPMKRKIVLYVEDMKMKMNCAWCWKDKITGECYTSKTIHTDMWLWYSVCYDCYKKERDEEDLFRC